MSYAPTSGVSSARGRAPRPTLSVASVRVLIRAPRLAQRSALAFDVKRGWSGDPCVRDRVSRGSGGAKPAGVGHRARCLMVLAGLVVLGHVVVATVVSVIFLGWFAVLGGLAGVVASLFRLGKPGFWPTLLGGALALAVGIAFLRRPGLSAAALTPAGGPGSSGGSASTTSTAVGSSPTASSRCCSGCSSCSGGRARPCGCWARSSVL